MTQHSKFTAGNLGLHLTPVYVEPATLQGGKVASCLSAPFWWLIWRFQHARAHTATSDLCSGRILFAAVAQSINQTNWP